MCKITNVELHYNDQFVQVFIHLDEGPEFLYDRVKTEGGDRLLVARAGPLLSTYEFAHPSGRFKAFAGREFEIPLKSGEVERANGQWWHVSLMKFAGENFEPAAWKVNERDVPVSCTARVLDIVEWLKWNAPLETNKERFGGMPVSGNVWWASRKLYELIAGRFGERYGLREIEPEI